MVTSRRGVLAAGLVGGAATLAGCTGAPNQTPPPSIGPTTNGAAPNFNPADWESVRAQFRLDPKLAHFAAFVLSPHVTPVATAIDEHRRQLDADPELALSRGGELEQQVRIAAAAHSGSQPGDYALTGSTTEGIAIMYGGLSLTSRDEILTTTHDFYSTEETLQTVAARSGAAVRRISLYDEPARATVDQMVDAVVRAVSARTRVIALTWVHSSTGVRVPVRQIADALGSRRDDLLLCVDGVHGFGASDVALPDLGCDFLATGTHKWLFGPRGTGILYGRDWQPLTALVPTFSARSGAGRLTPGGYHAFEHQWATAAAFAFHHAIGRDRVAQRTSELAGRLKAGLADAPNVKVITPAAPELGGGIVCLDVDGVPGPDAAYRLREAGIACSVTPYATVYLRLGPSIANNPDQVDAAVRAITALA